MILAIDIGTSSCKAAIFTLTGEVVASSARDYAVLYPHPNHAEQDPNQWWNAVCKACKEIVAGHDIEAIAVAGQSWSAVMVDSLGNPIFNSPIWMDGRSEDVCQEILAKIPAEDIFDLCGNHLRPAFTTGKILWFKKHFPNEFARVCKVLQSNSFIVHCLTGVFSQDTSQGYGLHFFDTRKLQWDKNMAKEMGISLDLMPDIYSPSQVVGWVTKSAALLTGIREGVPVVAGGLDAACSALGAGVSASGETQCQGGSAGGMSLCLDSPIMHPKLILSPHVVPGCWLLQGGTVGGGGVLRWLKDNVLDGVSYEEMSWLAAESEPGSVVFCRIWRANEAPYGTQMQKVFFLA